MTPIQQRRRPRWVLILPAALLAMAGCTPVGAVIGAGAMVGTAVAEERGLDGTAKDVEIKLTLLKRYDDGDVLFRGIAATVMEGRVLLTGQITDAAVLDEAVRLAWRVDGVKDVINEVVLTDRPESGTDLRDALIEADLRQALMFDTSILAINYAVEVEDGIVYLLGIAQSETERQRAVAHARATSYVRRVVDHSILKTDPRRAVVPSPAAAAPPVLKEEGRS